VSSFLEKHTLLTSLLVLGVFNALVLLVLLVRTGRIIADHNNFAEALVQAMNFQTTKLTALSDDVHSSLDCMLTVDADAASSDISV
jgi:hypothetical protein